MSEPVRLPNFGEQLVLAAQQSSPTARLVGGAGLALLLGHRRSDDLDLFCTAADELTPLVRAIEDAARSGGAAASRVRTSPSFVRLEIAGQGDVLRVDVALDPSPRLSATDTYAGPVRVESLRDQRANKLVSLLGRSELRDLVDLLFIERAGWPAIEGFDDALRKDGGMDPTWFAWALSQITIGPLRGMIAPLDVSELERYRDALCDAALDLAGSTR